MAEGSSSCASILPTVTASRLIKERKREMSAASRRSRLSTATHLATIALLLIVTLSAVTGAPREVERNSPPASMLLDDYVAQALQGHLPLRPQDAPARIELSRELSALIEEIRVKTVQPSQGQGYGTEYGSILGFDASSGRLTSPGLVGGPKDEGQVVFDTGDRRSVKTGVGIVHSHPREQSHYSLPSPGDIAGFLGEQPEPAGRVLGMIVNLAGDVTLLLRTKATGTDYHSNYFYKALWATSVGCDKSIDAQTFFTVPTHLLSEFAQLALYRGTSESLARVVTSDLREVVLELREDSSSTARGEQRHLRTWERIAIQGITALNGEYQGPFDGVFRGSQKAMIRRVQEQLGDAETGYLTRLQKVELFADYMRQEGDLDVFQRQSGEVVLGLKERKGIPQEGEFFYSDCRVDDIRWGVARALGSPETNFEGNWWKRFSSNGSTFIGHVDYLGDRPSGNGRMTWPSGNWWEGPIALFKERWLPHGEGTYRLGLGAIVRGRKEQGRFVGRGTWEEDGMKWEVDLEQGSDGVIRRSNAKRIQ